MIGAQGTGLFSHDNEASTSGLQSYMAVVGQVLLGDLFGSTGTYNLGGGTVLVGNVTNFGGGPPTDLIVGNAGTGIFNHGNATGDAVVNVSGSLILGAQATGTGTYTTVDSGSGPTITLNVGTAAVFDPGSGPSDPPVLRPGTGTGALIVGDSGVGTFNLQAGTLNVLNDYVGVNAFVIGSNAGSVGKFTQTGGVVNGGRSLTIGQNGGTGTYNLSTDLGQRDDTRADGGHHRLGQQQWPRYLQPTGRHF